MDVCKGNQRKYYRFRAVRISGNEPTLCKSHLLDVIRAVELSDPTLLFVLEMNGIKLGEDEK